MKLLAQSGIGTITPPAQVGNIANQTGAQGLTTFVNLLLTLIVSASTIIFLFMILWGGVQWITSGGNKDKVAAARGRITHAIIGLAIVALAFVIAQTVGQILGFNIFNLAGNGAPNCPPRGNC